MAFIYNFLFYDIILLLSTYNSFMINIIVYSRYFIGTLS